MQKAAHANRELVFSVGGHLPSHGKSLLDLIWNRSKCTHQNFVDMFLRRDVEALGKSRTDKPRGPSAVTVTSRNQHFRCMPASIAGWTIHLLFLTVCGTNQREYLLRRAPSRSRFRKRVYRFGPTRVFSSRYLKSLHLEDFSQASAMPGCRRRVVPLPRTVSSSHSGRIAARTIRPYKQY